MKLTQLEVALLFIIFWQTVITLLLVFGKKTKK